ncbi:MAG: DUF2095 family protein [Candidatus Lokiarchaeota archaeon]|nr:DUF2095 family protein [Candidatus Lokiarchaeota archaeon]
MDQKETKEKEKFIELQVSEDEGLKILYAKTKLEEYFPNLTSEINEEKKTMKISSIEVEEDELRKVETNNVVIKYEENLSNPGVIDFLRRCSTSKEAMNILDYLNARKELSKEIFNYLKERISNNEGLLKLIEECGGPKKKGYYIDKFYNLNENI